MNSGGARDGELSEAAAVLGSLDREAGQAKPSGGGGESMDRWGDPEAPSVPGDTPESSLAEASATPGTDGASSMESADKAALEPLAKPSRDFLPPLLEAMLFASGRPISAESLAAAIPGVGRLGVERGLAELRLALENDQRGLRLREVAGGFRLEAAPATAPYIAQLGRIRREETLTPAALETLAVVAFKQPITKTEIEAIRGVDASSSLKALLDKSLVRVSGRAPGPGRPLLYSTSRRFLERFGLRSIEDLPPPPEPPAATPRSLHQRPQWTEDVESEVSADTAPSAEPRASAEESLENSP